MRITIPETYWVSLGGFKSFDQYKVIDDTNISVDFTLWKFFLYMVPSVPKEEAIGVVCIDLFKSFSDAYYFDIKDDPINREMYKKYLYYTEARLLK